MTVQSLNDFVAGAQIRHLVEFRSALSGHDGRTLKQDLKTHRELVPKTNYRLLGYEVDINLLRDYELDVKETPYGKATMRMAYAAAMADDPYQYEATRFSLFGKSRTKPRQVAIARDYYGLTAKQVQQIRNLDGKAGQWWHDWHGGMTTLLGGYIRAMAAFAYGQGWEKYVSDLYPDFREPYPQLSGVKTTDQLARLSRLRQELDAHRCEYDHHQPLTGCNIINIATELTKQDGERAWPGETYTEFRMRVRRDLYGLSHIEFRALEVAERDRSDHASSPPWHRRIDTVLDAVMERGRNVANPLARYLWSKYMPINAEPVLSQSQKSLVTHAKTF